MTTRDLWEVKLCSQDCLSFADAAWWPGDQSFFGIPMDFPALSKLQHAEGAQTNYAAVFNMCSFAKSLEIQHLWNT